MNCDHCNAAVHEGTHLCRRCSTTLDVALANIAAYVDDMETVRTRQTRYSEASGGGTGAKGKTMPLGMDLRFDVDGRGTIVERTARATLARWVRRALDTWPGTRMPIDTVPAMCHFLTSIRAAIAGQPWAKELLGEMLDSERQLRAFVDRPPERIYAGTCIVCAIVGEHSPLYAHQGDDKILCPAEDCRKEYDVAECRETLLATVDGLLCTAAQIASLATYFGVLEDREKVRKRINLWDHRGVIQPDGLTPEGEPTYAFGDTVQAILRANDARKRPTIRKVLGRTPYDPKADTRPA